MKERERVGGCKVGETQAALTCTQGFPSYGISVNGQGNERCGGIIVIDGH